MPRGDRHRSRSASLDRDRERRRHHKKVRRDRSAERDDRSEADGSGEGEGDEDQVGPPPPAISSRLAKLGVDPISADDFLKKAPAFKQWAASRGKYLDEMAASKARDLFATKFVKKWNAGDLDDHYYSETRSSAISTTRHKWSFKVSSKDRETMASIRDSTESLTNSTSLGAVEAREHDRRVGGGKRMTERGGEQESGASAADRQYQREQDAEASSRARKDERRRENATHRDDLEALAPRATGREAVFERRQEKAASHRSFAERHDAMPEVSDDVLMGTEDRASYAAPARKGEDRRAARKAEQQRDLAVRVEASRQKEADTLAHFRKLAAERFG